MRFGKSEDENSQDDALAINDNIRWQVLVEILNRLSMSKSMVCVVQYDETWMCPVYSYLANSTMLSDKAQA